MKLLNKSLIAAVALAAGSAAQAEVSGSVAIASAYLWRGFDLGFGSAAVSGSLDYSSESGLYAGIWGSSGDDFAGTEYDLYVGYGFEAGGVGIDLAYVDYNYPDTAGAADFEEIILGLSAGSFGLTYADAVDSSTYYLAGSYDVADFGFVLGYVDAAGGGTGYHLDATYNMGDLAFTLSQSFDDGVFYSEEVQFVVSYSIPLSM